MQTWGGGYADGGAREESEVDGVWKAEERELVGEEGAGVGESQEESEDG